MLCSCLVLSHILIMRLRSCTYHLSVKFDNVYDQSYDKTFSHLSVSDPAVSDPIFVQMSPV